MPDSIRKISVGPDYKDSMTYTCGAPVLDGKFKIRHIKRNASDETLIYIINDVKEVFLWKTFTPSVPIYIEYNINF